VCGSELCGFGEEQMCGATELTVHSIHTGAQSARRGPAAGDTGSHTAQWQGPAQRRPTHRYRRPSLRAGSGDHGVDASAPALSHPDLTDELSARPLTS